MDVRITAFTPRRTIVGQWLCGFSAQIRCARHFRWARNARQPVYAAPPWSEVAPRWFQDRHRRTRDTAAGSGTWRSWQAWPFPSLSRSSAALPLCLTKKLRIVKEFDPIVDVVGSESILDGGEWPNFHDAEVHNLNLWRGDVRPDEGVWIGPVVEVVFELCALKTPYIVVLRFHDCDAIRLHEFNHQNAVYDLRFEYEERGAYRDGTPLPPFILVDLEQAFGVALSLKCMRVEAVERREIGDAV